MTAVVRAPGEGETITEQAVRAVQILDDHAEITVAEARYATGERRPDPHIHREQATS